MKTLREVMVNNLIFSIANVNFVNPFFRRISGQFPYDIPTLTISESNDKKKEEKLKQICKNRKDPFILIIRDEKACLEDILFIPPRGELKSLAECNEFK